MTTRTAGCSCGALSISTRGEPVKVSVCHCDACQKRTGSAFSVAVFFDIDQTTPDGPSSRYGRVGDSGKPLDFHFCPTCASTVFWYPKMRPNWVGVAIGCFDDKSLRPTQAVYGQEARDWVTIAIEGG